MVTGGIITSTVAGGSSASVSEFMVRDSHIRTADGTVTSVNAEATFEIGWEGIDGEGTLSVTLTAENVATGESTAVVEMSDELGATHGTRTYAPDDIDLLTTSVFEAKGFEAEENDTEETDIRYELLATLETGDTTRHVTTADTATVSVEHVADPRVESVDVVDDSNPARDRAIVTWTVSDPGGRLDEVTTELRPEESTETLDAQTTSVDGSDADGEHELESNDGGPYEIATTVTNTDGNTDTETNPFGTAQELDDGDTVFETLTAEITDTRGGNDAPSEATFEYAIDSSEPHTIQFTLEVDGNTDIEVVEGTTDGTAIVDGGGGQPPNTDTATVTADIDGGERCSADITEADGQVTLCE